MGLTMEIMSRHSGLYIFYIFFIYPIVHFIFAGLSVTLVMLTILPGRGSK